MVYDLNTEFDRKRFFTRVKQLLDNKKTVELTDASRRTYKQNNYLHTIIAYFALQCGMTKKEAKEDIYKKMCNKELFVRKVFNRRLGMEVEVLRSSRELTAEEMSLSIERFRNWSAEQGIYLASPDEKNYLEVMALEIEHNKEWL